jgi:uncharacterized protein YoaH (UPF0181 family)
MEEIAKEFMAGGMSFSEAIWRLQSLGWQSEDAEDQVQEWADSAE